MEHVLCDVGAQYLRWPRWAPEKVIRSFDLILYQPSRAVREAESNFQHMKDVQSITPCMKKLKNTTSYTLTPEEIEACDEDVAKPKGKGWIKKYHHFSYDKPGVINCQYVRGVGAYQTNRIVQLEGVSVLIHTRFHND